MKNDLQSVIQKVDGKNLNFKKIEGSVSSLVEDYGGANYYEAIRLICKFYGHPFVLPNPVPLTNVRISDFYTIQTTLKFWNDEEDPFSCVHFSDTEDKLRNLGTLIIHNDGSVVLSYDKISPVFNDNTDESLTDGIATENIRRIAEFKNLWKNANVAAELMRVLNDLF